MNDNKDYLAKDISRHKPKLFIPIFNTIIGIIFTVFMVRVTIVNKVSVGYLILVILLMIIFVGGSWYTSFFFRRKNKKLTQDFETETKILFEAMYELKKGTYIEPKTPVKWEIKDTYQNAPLTKFDKIKRCFVPKEDFEIFINLGTNCCGLVVDGNTLEAKSFQGVSPYSLWQKKRIVLPLAKDGSIKLNMDGFQKTKKLTLKILNETDTYYNPKSGIFAVGDIHQTALDENIKIGENIIVSLYDNEIKCVYVLLDTYVLDK